LIGAGLENLVPELLVPKPGTHFSMRVGRQVVSRLNRLRSLGHQLRLQNITEFFNYRRAIWRESGCLICNPLPQIDPEIGGSLAVVNAEDAVSQMMQLEATRYLPDDIMVKVDRASMAVSLDSRAPLLDHRVVELAWRLPLNCKLRNGRGKWILRKVLYRYVPRDLVDRPKTGFGVPINRWLRGPLRGWAEDLLAESRIRHQGLFNSMVTRSLWWQFLEERLDYGYQFWVLLMFQAWLAAHPMP
jgi:asparagine synthase (glutamine-hydrolysing)